MGDPSRRDARVPLAPDSRPLGALADLADLLGGESERSRRFLGGLIAGALVGAAIVGSAGAAVLRRREARDRSPESPHPVRTTGDAREGDTRPG